MAESHLRKSDSIVVVGASRGIGAGFVQYAAQQGFKKFHLVARSAGKLESLKKSLSRQYNDLQIHVHSCDLMSEKSFMAFMHELQNENDFPRHWVLCVGGSSSGKIQREPFESTPWETLENLVKLNLMLPMRILHQVVPELMRPNADGVVEPSSVIAIASQAAHHPVAGMSAYAAAKHGLFGLIRSVADEVRDLNMRLSVISPGFVDTELVPSHPNLDRSKMIKVDDVSKAILFALECSSSCAPVEIHLKPQQSPWQ